MVNEEEMSNQVVLKATRIDDVNTRDLALFPARLSTQKSPAVIFYP